MTNNTEIAFYIGIMTGNSMDAVDVASAWFSDGFFKTGPSFSKPFSRKIIDRMHQLRALAESGISMETFVANPIFKETHDTYVRQVADAVTEFIRKNDLNPSCIAAICTHGKTLDHCPPSHINGDKTQSYTLQIGSGKMLADLISQKLNGALIRVLYDFRSNDVVNGGEGAPLMPPFSALLARQEGEPDKIDFNAGNTSNLTVIHHGLAVQAWDAGPCNEFTDHLVRRYTSDSFDKDGKYALNGQLDTDLLQHLYDMGRSYYERAVPKSGDPAYYHFDRIQAFETSGRLNDKIHTAAYFAAYTAALTLRFVTPRIEMPTVFSLYGGGWHHPIVYRGFKDLLSGQGFILPEHKTVFQNILARFKAPPRIKLSQQQQTMESLLLTAMGAAYDKGMPWTHPHLTGCKTPTVCGREAISHANRITYDDYLSLAAKGWQTRLFIKNEKRA